MSPEIFGGVFSFIASALGCWLIVATQRTHGHLTKDATSGGSQKFSRTGAPRVGGIALFVAIVLVAGTLAMVSDAPADVVLLLALAAVPAWMGGVADDLTKKVSVGLRLRFAFVSAGIAFFLVDARVASLGLPYIDPLLASFAVSALITLFAVGGFSHAMNIIDGFNGLFGLCALLMLGGIAAVAIHVGDQPILIGAAIVGGAVLGFLLFNYPGGRLLAGDGGAYLIGFLVAELAVLLVHRNSEISPWFALTLLAYPVFETVFSIYRKKFVRGRPIGKPDGSHFHMLVHRRVIRWHPGSKLAAHRNKRNALTSPYLWLLCLFCVVAAVSFRTQQTLLQISVAAFVVLYVWLYVRIVHFQVPRFLLVRSEITEPAPAVIEGSAIVQAKPK